MHKQDEKINKEIETIEIIELKSTMHALKYSIENFKSKHNKA